MAFVWNKQNLVWFEKAAELTTFYRDIAAHCAFLLRPSARVLDLGCGAGYLSLALAPHVESVTALDLNTEAIRFLRHKAAREGLGNIRGKVEDWTALGAEQSADVVFLSYCDGLMTRLDKLGELTRQYLVVVLPDVSRESRFTFGTIPLSAKPRKHRETLQKAVLFLGQERISYHLIRLSSEFGQPFDSVEDFEAFLEYYYRVPKGSIPPEELTVCLQKRGDGYYLPKRRQSGILILKKEDIAAWMTERRTVTEPHRQAVRTA